MDKLKQLPYTTYQYWQNRIGQNVYCRFPLDRCRFDPGRNSDLVIPVTIVDCFCQWGRTRVAVSPVNGSGKRLVSCEHLSDGLEGDGR